MQITQRVRHAPPQLVAADLHTAQGPAVPTQRPPSALWWSRSMVTARSLWKLPAVFIVLLSVKSHPWHRRSLWRLASAVQTPSLTRHKPVVTIPSLGSQEAPITHPRDGTRRLRAAGDGWFQELALAAKWGPFTSGELGQVTVIVGPGPREMKQQTPAPGLAPPPPQTQASNLYCTGNPAPASRMIDSLGPPDDALKRGLSVALDK